MSCITAFSRYTCRLSLHEKHVSCQGACNITHLATGGHFKGAGNTTSCQQQTTGSLPFPLYKRARSDKKREKEMAAKKLGAKCTRKEGLATSSSRSFFLQLFFFLLLAIKDGLLVIYAMGETLFPRAPPNPCTLYKPLCLLAVLSPRHAVLVINL